MRPEIEAYLREHGARYTTDALRRELINAGHAPAEVDAALRETEGSRVANRPGAADAPRGSGLYETAWALYGIGAMFGAMGAALLLLILRGPPFTSPPLVFVALYAVAYLGLGYLVVRLVRWAASRFEIHGVVAVLLGLVLLPVYAALMFGTCVAALNLARPGGG